MNTLNNLQSSFKQSAWLRRVGAASFSFFLVKGLLWLAAPFFFYLAV
jgi:hypothetical protein